MEATAVELVETTDVETKALSIVDQAKAVKVTDAETYTAAGELWKQIKDMMKEVSDTFDELIEKAHASHKAVLAKKAKYYLPLDQAYKAVKKLMSDYDLAQEKIRQAEEARLRDIARKAEEERQLMEAIAAEEAAKAAGATAEEAKAEAEAVFNEEVYVPPVVIPKTVPAMKGGPVFQTRWSAIVTDVKALCLAIGTGKASTEFVIGLDRDKEGSISSPSLNRQAVSLMNTLDIPGVKAISKRV